MKPFTRERAEAALSGPRSKERLEALRRLPLEVNVALVTKVVVDLCSDRNMRHFARNCRAFSPAMIRASLRAVAKVKNGGGTVFLREAVDIDLSDAELVKAWKHALQALLDLQHSASWGSSIRKAKFKAIAADATLLRAAQTAVVGGVNPSMGFLAVLATDASEASIDALLPVFSKGEHDEQLEKLEVHAKRTKPMKALLEAVSSRVAKNERANPAVTFVSQVLQLEKPLDSVNVMMFLSSEQTNPDSESSYQPVLFIDSRWQSWWSISLVRVTEDYNGPGTDIRADTLVDDQLGLGGCTFEELPDWLARAARKLKVTWRADELSSSLRGKKRTQFVEWLFSKLP